MTLERLCRRGKARVLAANVLFAVAILVPQSATAISDKWTGAISGGHVRDVHVFSRDGVAWGLIIDDGELTSGVHEHVPGNGGGGDAGGVNVANASAATVTLNFFDGTGTTVPAGESLFLPGDDRGFEYSIDYGSVLPGPQDTVRFQEIAVPFEQQGAQHQGIVNYEQLVDLGGATLGQTATQLSLRLENELAPTPLNGVSLFPIDPLNMSGKFMLIPVPEPSAFVLFGAAGMGGVARRRRGR